MSDEKPALCTTNGKPVDEVRAAQTNETGQHDGYIILCPDERKKGFVRPYRDAYEHVGRSICGKIVDVGVTVLGGCRVCDEPHGHEGECGDVFRTVAQDEQVKLLARHRIGGCGATTSMGQALSETYARQPSFYGATFCVGCNRHLPVAEFVWTADGQQVGS